MASSHGAVTLGSRTPIESLSSQYVGDVMTSDAVAVTATTDTVDTSHVTPTEPTGGSFKTLLRKLSTMVLMAAKGSDVTEVTSVEDGLKAHGVKNSLGGSDVGDETQDTGDNGACAGLRDASTIEDGESSEAMASLSHLGPDICQPIDSAKGDMCDEESAEEDGFNMDVDSSTPVISPIPPLISPMSSMGSESISGHPTMPAAAPPFGGPQPIEIVFSFDTTGSMSVCLEEVQRNLNDVITRLFMDVPSLRIAVIAHGDYCDREHFYVTKAVDFTNQVQPLCSFVSEVTGTGGGDWEECYELVLKQVGQDLSWTPGTQRALVMIGDAVPHPTGHGGNVDLDWRVEADRLYIEKGVRVYGVQCLSEHNKLAAPFWRELCDRTHGKYLRLDQFRTVIDLIMAVVYREHGPDFLQAYEKEVRLREGPGIRGELDQMFAALRDDDKDGVATRTTGPGGASTSAAAGTRKRAPPKTAARRGAAKKAPVGGSTGKRALSAKRKANAVSRKPATAATKAAPVKRRRKTPAPRAPPVERQLRENVTAAHFALRDLSWTSWKLLAVQTRPDPGHGRHGGWASRGSATRRPGFWSLGALRQLQGGGTGRTRHVAYEVAVQPKARSKLFAVHFHVTLKNKTRAGQPQPQTQRIPAFLRSGLAAMQLDQVLEQDCRVFVRQAPLGRTVRLGWRHSVSAAGLRRAVGVRYDYAWQTKWSHNASDVRGRSVLKAGVQISSYC